MVELNPFQGAIDDNFKLVQVLHFTPLRQPALGFGGADPCWLSMGLAGRRIW